MSLQTLTTPLPKRQRHQAPDPFPYGWRYVTKQLPTGQEIFYQIPLTQADFLNPQLGDQMVQRTKHFRCSTDLFTRLDNRYLNDPTVGVFSDVKLQWEIPDLLEPAPDVCVIPHLREKEPDVGTFKVSEWGTRPCLVIEVMSPHYPGDDTTKVEVYEQAGIPEYIIVNPYSAKTKRKLCYSLAGYRLAGKFYQPILPDKQGRLLSQTTGVLFGVSKDQQQVILTDAVTGKRLLTAAEEKDRREQAEAKAKLAMERAQLAEEKAQLALAQAEAEARARAELEKRLQELENQIRMKSG